MREFLEDIFINQPLDPMVSARQGARASLRKRFYKQALVGDNAGDGFPLLLDGKQVMTPARRPLAAPVRTLAETIAREWDAQVDVIDPASMPLTRLANVIIDGVAAAPAPVADEVAKYLGSDLLCYRADAPPGLVARQAALWDPVLDWAHDDLGARFVLTEGVVFTGQPEEALSRTRAVIPSDPWRLGAVAAITTLTGSALIALAMHAGAIDAKVAWDAAHVDEDWQMSQWGDDDMALARRAARFAEFMAAATVLKLVERDEAVARSGGRNVSDANHIVLKSGSASAVIARHGAQLMSWISGGRELMWSADPQFWARSAPILFPVVGASAGGDIIVSGQAYAMPQHGFARDSVFDVVQSGPDAVVLRLSDSPATRALYPFSFSVTVTYRLAGDTLSVTFDIANPGISAMPYQLGYHPAFVWPFLSDTKDGHELVFASSDPRPILRPDAQGLMQRAVAGQVEAGRLAIADDLFKQGALVFADAHSPTVRMTSPSGAEMAISVDGFSYWAIWTKPGAPFVSIEQWTGLPEWEDFKGELAERPSVDILAAGATRRHSIRMDAVAPHAA